MNLEVCIDILKQLQVKQNKTEKEQQDFKSLYQKVLAAVTIGQLKLSDVEEINGMVDEAMQIISRKKNDGGGGGGAGGGFRP